MFRVLARSGAAALRSRALAPQLTVGSIRASSHGPKAAEEIDRIYLDQFNKPSLDGWELRKYLSELHGEDMIPNGAICNAILKACRRVNDYALTTRFLESLKLKTQAFPSTYAHLMKEMEPTLKELGISTPEELGYDKPELYVVSPYEY